MNDWRIKDYRIRCYNLLNKITPYKAEMPTIKKRARAIQREKRCDILTAYKILKKQLEKEVAEKS